jgi:hypothetical protein
MAREFRLTIAGHGIEARAKLPIGGTQIDGGSIILGPMNLALAARDGVRNVVLVPGEPPDRPLERRAGGKLVSYAAGEGMTEVVLGTGMSSYDQMLEGVDVVDDDCDWTIVTEDHDVLWPEGFTLRADGDRAPGTWPYELSHHGSSERLIYLQGPFVASQIPPPEQLVGPGMELVDQGDLDGTINTVLWFELSYEHEGVPWAQRFYYLPIDSEGIYLMRAQTDDDAREEVFDAADLMAGSFGPR